MFAIQVCCLPQQALLAKYAQGGNFTDCYAAEVARPVTHAEYVEAFYTTTLFKLERLLLAWFASKPSTDAQAKELASGVLGVFAAWRVEERSANQLLMCDLNGRTRSWFMVTPAGSGSSTVTRLYFGLCRGAGRQQAIRPSNARLHIQGALGLSQALFAGAPVRGTFTPCDVRFGSKADMTPPNLA